MMNINGLDEAISLSPKECGKAAVGGIAVRNRRVNTRRWSIRKNMETVCAMNFLFYPDVKDEFNKGIDNII